MTPNVADFTVAANGDFDIKELLLECPLCDWFTGAENKANDWPTLRELIYAASEHARTEHPLSAPAAIQGT